MNSYCNAIRTIFLDMIIAEEIDFKYDEMKEIKDDEIINISSMDKVKIVIELESHFNIVIDDSLLGKLDNLKDYENIVKLSMGEEMDTRNRLDVLKDEVFNKQ